MGSLAEQICKRVFYLFLSHASHNQFYPDRKMAWTIYLVQTVSRGGGGGGSVPTLHWWAPTIYHFIKRMGSFFFMENSRKDALRGEIAKKKRTV
jgi:hypothetical protein